MRKLVSLVNAVNFMSQTVFSFVFPFGVWFFIGYLLTDKAGLDKWVFAVCVVLGSLNGFYGMFKYILSSAERFSIQQNYENDKCSLVDKKDVKFNTDSNDVFEKRKR